MAYAPPSLTSAGLTIPSYADIQNYLITQFMNVYGQNVYLGPDSADYQWISIVALAISDALQAAQLCYNARSPVTAVGSDLDAIIKLNGIARKAASFSNCAVTLTGTPNALILNGVVQDDNGFLWNLPANVTIGAGGTVTVTATCQTAGAVTAQVGQLHIIATPTAGWTSVTNAGLPVVGIPAEIDGLLRARQALSVAAPSLTPLAATIAAVAAVPGVSRYSVSENYFGYTASFGSCNTSGTALTLLTGYPLDASDVGQAITINGVANSIAAVASGTSATLTTSAGTQTGVSFVLGDGLMLGPAHSVTAVVEGGDPLAVAQAIYSRRGIGCFTNGSTTEAVTDPKTGAQINIRFSTPTYVPVYAALSVHPLAGYTTATTATIQAAIATYLNSLQIGETVVLSELYGAALSVRSNPEQPMFSIRALTLGTSASPTGTSDLTIAYNQVAQGNSANVTVTLV